MMKYVNVVSSNTTLDSAYNIYHINAGSNNITLTLPSITAEGQGFSITRIDNSTNTVTVTAADMQTINWVSSIILEPSQEISVVANTLTAWYGTISGAGVTGATGVGISDVALVGNEFRFTLTNSAVLPVPYASNFTWISAPADLPIAVEGVITLLPNHTYIMTTTVDLVGNRLVCGANTMLAGFNSEQSRIKSTGLNTALITSQYSLPMQNLTVEANVALALSGIDSNQALDWLLVNFTNCQTVGAIANYGNIILTQCMFLISAGLVFSGTVATVGLNNSLFIGLNDAITVAFASDFVCTRRLRITNSSFVVPPGATGINVPLTVTIPHENYILDTVNFAGPGIYTAGIPYDNNGASFVRCTGISNSTSIANIYFKNNAIATTVQVVEGRYPVVGDSELGPLYQRFELVEESTIPIINSVKYTLSAPNWFRIGCSFSLTSTNNNVIGIYIGIARTNGNQLNADADRMSESEIYITMSGSRPDSGFVQCLTTLYQNDRIYLIVQNKTNTNNITVNFMNLIVNIQS